MHRKEPDALATFAGHALVGGLVFYTLRRTPTTAFVGMIVGMAAHAAFDAPVAQKLSDFGI